MSAKVSVVVPVYNPGEHIEPCIDSLLKQTMPVDELELIFVDDGSTDQTPARLDRLAAEHPQVQVIHQENSGWAGGPRNVGTDAATGEYVQYLDQDDWLGPEALQRLYTFATAHDSDLVIGRVAGNRMATPGAVFEHTRASVTIHDHGMTPEGDLGTGLIGTLTPHKMFRRQFLLDHGIRFPEGRRRLEDHVFVVTAYFAAKTISIYADVDCYFHVFRKDRGNAGLDRLDPVGYFTNLREALDVVDAHTEPGPERDRLHSRWLRSEVVRRIRRPAWLELEPDEREALFDQMHLLVVDRFSPDVDVHEPSLDRHVTDLIRRGDLQQLTTLVRWEAGLRASVVAAGTVRADDLQVTTTLTLRDGGQAPLRLQPGPPVPAQVEIQPDVSAYAREVGGERLRSLVVGATTWEPGTYDGRVVLTVPRDLPDGRWQIVARLMLGGRAYSTTLVRPGGGGRVLVDTSPSGASLVAPPARSRRRWRSRLGALRRRLR